MPSPAYQEKDGPRPSSPAASGVYLVPAKRSPQPPSSPPVNQDLNEAYPSASAASGHQVPAKRGRSSSTLSSSGSDTRPWQAGPWRVERPLSTPPVTPKGRSDAPSNASRSSAGKYAPLDHSQRDLPRLQVRNPWTSHPQAPQRPLQSQRRPIDVSKVVPGIILRAPVSMEEIKPHSPLLRGQSWVNEAAGRHPLLIWNTYHQEDGELIARCLQMTSFGNGTVEDKYCKGGKAWRLQLQYLPIFGHYHAKDDFHRKGPTFPTSSWTNMPILAFENGDQMEKQSYVHLDHYFDIEARYLQDRTPERHLTEQSLCLVVHKLDQFVSDRIWRRKWGGTWKENDFPSPLDLPVPKGHRSFEADPTFESMARKGRLIEDFSNLQAGKVAVFGDEDYTGVQGQRKAPWETSLRKG